MADVVPRLQELVDDAGSLLGAPVVLEDTAFALIAYSSQEVDVDPVRAASILTKGAAAPVRAWFLDQGIALASGPVRIAADPGRGIAPRACLPARCDGVTHGYLWALEPPGGFAPDLLARAFLLAERAGALLAGRARAAGEHAGLVEDLLGGDLPRATAARAALAARGDLPATGPLAVVVVREPVPGPAGLLAVPAGDPEVLLDVARRHLRRTNPDHGRAGVSAPRADVRDLARARSEADCAARVACARPGLGRVLSWAGLGFYRVAAQGADAVRALVSGTPAALLHERADPDLVRTALTYLDQAGHAARTAAELSIHRQTLYYRLEKIEQLCGIDLDQGEARLQLHLGLALGELLPHLD